MPELKKIQLISGIPVFLLIQPNAPLFGSCQGLYVEGQDDDGILIDCVFDKSYMRSLIKDVGKRIQCHITTHFHIDHSSKIYLYERAGIPIQAPEKETGYLESVEYFIENTGLRSAGVDDLFKSHVMSFFDFRCIEHVEPVPDNKTWRVGDLIIEIQPLIGHSPGHPGFIIRSRNEDFSIFYATDIGLDKFGPWFGFGNASLQEFQNSINVARTTAERSSCVVPSHSKWIFNGIHKAFEDLLNKLSMRLNDTLSLIKKYPDGFKAKYCTKHKLIYKKSRIYKPMERIYNFWEIWMVEHLCLELVRQGRATLKKHETDPPQFPENVYRA
ncbi:MAG: MBL fold metallo-hydrolase [Promethearchaeota archaeon]